MSGPSWEAAATLATGIMAVVGAVIVGLRQLKVAERQAKIMQRQTEIAHRQTLLADLEVRAQLFDRRMRIYKATEAFIADILRDLKEPTADVKWQFLAVKAEAPLLFRPDVVARLNQLWSDAGEAVIYRDELLRDHATGDRFRDNTAQFSALSKIFTSLPDFFGDELKLTMPGADQGRS
ncbi:MAG: hypothetical protein JWO33_1014 [Caulobacteraceae bacterium]|nr:hypothetical protein [Caulobacteraceae bacterium]